MRTGTKVPELKLKAGARLFGKSCSTVLGSLGWPVILAVIHAEAHDGGPSVRQFDLSSFRLFDLSARALRCTHILTHAIAIPPQSL